MKKLPNQTQKGLDKEIAGKRKFSTIRDAMINFSPEMIEMVEWGSDVGKEVVR